MTTRVLRGLPWILLTAALLLYAGGGWFATTRGPLAGVPDFTWAEFSWPIPMLAFAAVGAVVAARRPSNPVGWCFLGIGFLMTVNFFCQSYARAALADGLPFVHVTAWLGFWTWVPAVGLFPFVFLLFPSGRVQSPRWRVAVAIAIAVQIGSFVSAWFVFPNSAETLVRNVNLGAVEGGAPLAIVANGGGQTIVLVSIISLVMRFIGSRGVERQQIKWFAFGATLMAASIGLMIFLPYEDPFSVGWVAGMFTVAVSTVPVAAGVAILKYRLYDIDLIVNRTLVYAILTAVLAGSYLLVVVALQRLLEPVTQESDLAVAASTLVVAGLFRPLRSRIQAFIDQRFYRRKYDAALTLSGFSARLREQVDLDALNQELLAIVGATMQPAHASLWLKRTGATG